MPRANLLLISDEPARTGCETTLSRFRANDDKNMPFSAARHSDRVLRALDAIYPRPLQGRLDDLARDNFSSCGLTAHLKLPAADGCLHGHGLFIVQELGLADASGNAEHQGREKQASFFHWSFRCRCGSTADVTHVLSSAPGKVSVHNPPPD